MSLAKPLLFTALGAAGLGASVVGQQAAPAPVTAPAGVTRVEVVEVDDEPTPPAPPPPARAAAQSTRPGPGVIGGPGTVVGGGMMPPGAGGVGGGFGYFPAAPSPEEANIQSLARRLAGATDDEVRAKFRTDLRLALTRAFDDRLKTQVKQLADLEKQLKRLKDALGKRREARAEIVADRLAHLEKEAKGLGW